MVIIKLLSEEIPLSPLTTQYADLGDIQLAYREHGEGPMLLLLHGNSGSKALFKKYQLKYFRDHRTLAVDSLGHGQSISTDGEYSIEQYADAMIRLCEAKGIESARVIGYSDGGNIALLLAKKAPALYEKILAISPNYLVSGTVEGVLKWIRAAVKIFEFLGECGFNTKKILMRFMLMLKDIGISDAELSGIQTNLMLLYAENDIVKEEHVLQIGRLVPKAKVRKIAHCTHFTILHKRETIEAIREFFAS